MKGFPDRPALRKLLDTMLAALVQQPEGLDITENQKERELLFDVKLERLTSRDIGRIVGSEGKTLQALRRILKSSAGLSGKACDVRFFQFSSQVDFSRYDEEEIVAVKQSKPYVKQAKSPNKEACKRPSLQAAKTPKSVDL